MAISTPSLQNSIGFLYTLQSVKPHSLEDAVQSVWQGIVLEWFPGRHGYKWRFWYTITVIRVRALTHSPEDSTHWDERQIFVIRCKRPSSDTASGWRDTTGQLQDDLSEISNHPDPLFGAVAIGKKVRFYRFEGQAPQNQQMVQLHQGIIDMDTVNGIAQVEDMMDYVSANSRQ
jgi:hypothetical protein